MFWDCLEKQSCWFPDALVEISGADFEAKIYADACGRERKKNSGREREWEKQRWPWHLNIYCER